MSYANLTLADVSLRTYEDTPYLEGSSCGRSDTGQATPRGSRLLAIGLLAGDAFCKGQRNVPEREGTLQCVALGWLRPASCPLVEAHREASHASSVKIPVVCLLSFSVDFDNQSVRAEVPVKLSLNHLHSSAFRTRGVSAGASTLRNRMHSTFEQVHSSVRLPADVLSVRQRLLKAVLVLCACWDDRFRGSAALLAAFGMPWSRRAVKRQDAKSQCR